MSSQSIVKRETDKQDVQCLYSELLKKATPEQKEKALIAATAFLMGASSSLKTEAKNSV